MRTIHRLANVFMLAFTVGLVSCGNNEDGAISTTHDDEKTTITIDRQKIKKQTQEAVKSAEGAGRRALDETGNALQEAGKALKRAAGDDEGAPPEP